MSPFGQATFSSVLVVNEHSTLVTYQTRSHHFRAQKSIQELVFFPVSLLQKLLSSFQSSCGISPHFKPKCDAGPLFLQLCCFLRYIRFTNVTIQTRIQQHNTKQSHVLQPYFQHKMTQQTPSTYYRQQLRHFTVGPQII